MLILAGILTFLAFVLWILDNSVYDSQINFTTPIRTAVFISVILVGLNAFL
jgi:hypothetical protein